jgi:predicted aspartyl protease
VSFSFDPVQGLILVRAEMWGPDGSAVLRLALDTGATGTLVNVAMLVAIGYDPALASDRLQVTTGSGVEFAPRVVLDRAVALGQKRTGFPVLAHTLPPSAGVDGLLGLDFFRGQSLTIDFRRGEVTLA